MDEAAKRAADVAHVSTRIDELVEKWRLHPSLDVTARVTELFELEAVDLRSGVPAFRHVIDVSARHEIEVADLFQRARSLEFDASDKPRFLALLYVADIVYNAKKHVLTIFHMTYAAGQLECGGDGRLDDDIIQYLQRYGLNATLDGTGLTFKPRQIVQHYIYESAYELGLRQQGGWVYEPVVIDGRETHAYRRTVTVEEFVGQVCRSDVNLAMWQNLRSGNGSWKAIVDEIVRLPDRRFPVLVRDRSARSYRNGVYIAREDRFYPYATAPLPKTLASVTFFDREFDEALHSRPWRETMNRDLNSIGEYQEWPRDVIEWLYVRLGALIYEVGELDGWQSIAFLCGAGGSGKSTVINHVVTPMFGPGDVGVLNSNCEKMFALSSICDALVWTITEVLHDIGLDQGAFQSMVSGEEVMVAVKHRKAAPVKWTAPGILAGNQQPNWSDNANSLSRRVLVFDFPKTVKDADHSLSRRLRDAVPDIFVTANRAYLEAAHEHGTKEIWRVLPDYFAGTRRAFQASRHSLVAFLVSTRVVLGEDAFCSFDEFKLELREFEKQMGFPQVLHTTDYFRQVFADTGIRTVRDRREHRGRLREAEWVVGACLADDNGGGAVIM